MSHYRIETDMLTLFTEITCLSLAIFTGVLAFRPMNRFFRILLLQLITWILFYAGTYFITAHQQATGQQIDDRWLMNIHLIIETGLLLSAAWVVLPKTLRLVACIGAFSLFLLVLGIQVRKQGFEVYLNYADVAACIVVTLAFSLVLYTFGQQKSVRLWQSPEKWACLGILMYFACSVPYVSMMNYLQMENPKVNTFLYYLISGVLANLRYFLLALAFWLIYRKTKQKTLNV